MTTAEDITGQRFGRLVAIERRVVPGQDTKWLFACDCGAKTLATPASVRSGNTKSCGCLAAERKRGPLLRHGHTGHAGASPTYRAWANAKLRLKPTKTASGKLRPAVKMSPSWKADFEAFLEDMGECPEGHKLVRVDRALGYVLENCKWEPKSAAVAGSPVE